MFHGSIVAMITPMDASGRVQLERIPALVDYLVTGGSTGLVVAGTTGESASLEDQEYEALLEAVLDAAAGRVAVLAGTGKASTAASIAQTQIARRCGVDAALVVTPYYYRPTAAGLLAHYQAIARAVDLPIVLYNVPARTACDLPVHVVARLARLEPVVAIKEATPGTARIAELLDACQGELDVLSGDDGSCADAMLTGARGVISVAANVAPSQMAELCRLALKGDQAGAMTQHELLDSLFVQLGIESNPIPVKWAATELNLTGPGIRLPLLPLEEQYREGLKACLVKLGLLARRKD
jgi:4-hydroxy-tetrahydrodipicolinate synthase